MTTENIFSFIPAVLYPIYVTTYQITSVIEKQDFILRYMVESWSLQAFPPILAFLQNSTPSEGVKARFMHLSSFLSHNFKVIDQCPTIYHKNVRNEEEDKENK
jgi:hypothetical protein